MGIFPAGLLKKIPSFLIPLSSDNDAARVKVKGIRYKDLFVLRRVAPRPHARDVIRRHSQPFSACYLDRAKEKKNNRTPRYCANARVYA